MLFSVQASPCFLMALVCALFLANTYHHNFISDDTFITLRYARNLAEGHGLVFNPGERVEGFTSLLWTLVLAPLHLLGLDLLASARILGTALGGTTLLLTYKLALVGSPKRLPPAFAALAPLVLAANGSFACWAASGMETMLYACLVAGSFLTLFQGRIRLSALLACALLLTRPEGLPVAGLLGLALWAEREKHPRAHVLAWGVACGLTLASLYLFRHLYFGDWLPNTYYAKTGGGLAQIKRGILYFSHYGMDHEGLPVLVALVLHGLCTRHAPTRWMALGAGGLWLSTLLSGGDGLPMYRFALAQLPLLAILLAHRISDIHAWTREQSAKRWAADVLAVGCVSAVLATHATPPFGASRSGTYRFQKNVEIPIWTQVGKWLAEHAREGDSVAAVPIGAVSYYSGLTTFDMMGLTDKHIARRIMPDMGRGWAGHDKRDGQYILGRRPTYLLLGNIDVTHPPRDPSQRPFIPYRIREIWDREADIYDGDLLETLYEPRSAEIAPGMFLNYFHLRE